MKYLLLTIIVATSLLSCEKSECYECRTQKLLNKAIQSTSYFSFCGTQKQIDEMVKAGNYQEQDKKYIYTTRTICY